MKKTAFFLLTLALLAISCASVKPSPPRYVLSKYEVQIPEKIVFLEGEDRIDPLSPVRVIRPDTTAAHTLYYLVYGWNFMGQVYSDTLQVFQSDYEKTKIGDEF